MTIGIVSPFNPSSVKEFFPNTKPPVINEGATSVNTLVRSLLQEGHTLKVFTICNDIVNTEILVGKNIEVYLIPTLLSSKISGFKHHLLLDAYYVHKRLSDAVKKEIKNLDVLHAHWTYDFAEACLPFVKEIPVFVTVRDWAPLQYNMQNRLIDKLVWAIKLKKFRKVMGNKDVYYIANSEYTLELILSKYPNSQTIVIPNPIKKELVSEVVPNKIEHSFISISIDLDEPRKNISSLILAFKQYKEKYNNAELHLVGSINKEGDNYKTWVEKGLLDGVSFHGKMNHPDIMKLMDEIRVLVHPSLEETFGNVLLEAMAKGVICIGGQDAGAVPYVLNHGKSGLLCDIIKPTEIFEAMDSLNESDIYNRIVSASRFWLLDNYLSDAIARRHICLYKENVSKREN